MRIEEQCECKRESRSLVQLSVRKPITKPSFKREDTAPGGSGDDDELPPPRSSAAAGLSRSQASATSGAEKRPAHPTAADACQGMWLSARDKRFMEWTE